MKRIFLSLIALLCASAAGAQAPNVCRLVSAGAQPSTSVKVSLVLERETLRSGPYARYAQKYLGVIAPLADRTSWSLLGGTLDYDAPGHAATASEAAIDVEGGDFERVPLDKTSAYEKSTEEMAREAANTIFQLRQQRLSILTGDAGELYPGGAGAVLSEITRMENEYLSLFLGKKTTSRVVRDLFVVPVQGKMEYAVCLFSDAAGVGKEGEQVTLAIAPEGGAHPEAVADKRATALWRVADYAGCTLRAGGRELSTARIPIFQLGATVAGAAL